MCVSLWHHSSHRSEKLVYMYMYKVAPEQMNQFKFCFLFLKVNESGLTLVMFDENRSKMATATCRITKFFATPFACFL